MGLRFYAPCVVLTVGTFLGGKIHIGESQQEGGRAGREQGYCRRSRGQFQIARDDRRIGRDPTQNGRGSSRGEVPADHQEGWLEFHLEVGVLEVQQGQGIALVGGDMRITGELSAPSGQVSLISAASPER